MVAGSFVGLFILKGQIKIDLSQSQLNHCIEVITFYHQQPNSYKQTCMPYEVLYSLIVLNGHIRSYAVLAIGDCIAIWDQIGHHRTVL